MTYQDKRTVQLYQLNSWRKIVVEAVLATGMAVTIYSYGLSFFR